MIPTVGIGARTVVHTVSVVVQSLKTCACEKRTLNDQITTVERSILGRVRRRVVFADDRNDGELCSDGEMEGTFFEREKSRRSGSGSSTFGEDEQRQLCACTRISDVVI